MLPTEYNDDLVQDFEIEDDSPRAPMRWRFDGYPCSGGKLDGLEAMKQAVFLILQTERFQYAIYSMELRHRAERPAGSDHDAVSAGQGRQGD